MSKICIRYASCWRLMHLALQMASATLALAFLPVGVVAADGGLFSADDRAVEARRAPQDLFHEGGLAEGKSRENWHLGTASRFSPILRSRTARLDLQQLAKARLDVQARRPAKLMLNLFADAAFAVALERTEPTASGYALTGRIEGEPLSMVVLAVNGDLMEGTVWLPGATHGISAMSGTASIRQLAPAKLPHPRELATLSAGDALDSATTSDGSSTFTVVADLASASDEAIPADDGSVIDVLVIYPPMVRQAQGGHRAMRTLIDHDIASTNEAYRVSGVRQRIALAGAFEVDYPSEGAEESEQDGLKLLVGKSDGYMDEVHALRDSYAADLVLFHTGDKEVLVPNFNEFLILQDPMHQNAERFAFNSAYSNRVQFKFAHFLGHNMGLVHQRGAYPHKSGKFPYSHGYVLPKPSPPNQQRAPAAWHTIMAWGSIDVIPRFSNPNHRYPDETGAPLGIPGDDWSDSVDGPADVVRSLNNTRQAVANFRNSGHRCTYDLSPTPPTLPSSGGKFKIQVSTASGCAWTARSHDQFVFITQSGIGNGEVTYRVEANDDWDREAAVLVAGEIYLLKQFGSRPFMPVCDRALEIQRALTQTIGKPCGNITAADLANLGILDLSNSSLTALEAGAFDGLSNLFELNLRGNQLTTLPPRAFSSLRRLQKLHLGWNRLTDLTPGAFDGLPQLSWLGLAGNLLATLERGIFSGLANLEVLILQHNAMTRLTPSVFEGLPHLKWLHLANNEFTKLEPNWFVGLAHLTTLDLTRVSLKTIESGAFNGLSNLQVLNLSHNELTAIGPSAFKELPNLVDLWLGENNFQTIETGAFYGLSSLKTLSLTGHQLRVLQPGLLAGLPNLRKLDLSGNNFNTLQVGLFDELHGLQGLNAGGNSLQSLQSGVFDGLSNLKRLKIMVSALRTLDSGVFRGLSSLETLRFGGLLDTLPPGLFNGLTNLRQLDLSDNPGAPFSLNLDMVRLATGTLVQGRPSEMAIRVREGAPFDMLVGLSVSDGVTSSSEVQLSAGRDRSDAVSVTPNGNQPVTVGFGEIPAVPAGPLCLNPAYWLDGDRRPCFLGVQTVAGAPLAFYELPDQTLNSFGSTTLDLASVFSYFLGAATYEVESSNPRVVSASIAGGLLTIAANGEGIAILTVTATGSDGSALERRFRVAVAPPTPRIRGWRLWLWLCADC